MRSIGFSLRRRGDRVDSLFLDLGDDLWLKVYNGLDENGYELHTGKPGNANAILYLVLFNLQN